MFAAVHYVRAENRKRKFDVISVSEIENFTVDYDKKKFKMTTPEGDKLQGLILFTGSDENEMKTKMQNERPRHAPLSMCKTASNLQSMLPKSSKKVDPVEIKKEQIDRMNKSKAFVLNGKENIAKDQSLAKKKDKSKEEEKNKKTEKSNSTCMSFKTKENSKITDKSKTKKYKESSEEKKDEQTAASTKKQSADPTKDKPESKEDSEQLKEMKKIIAEQRKKIAEQKAVIANLMEEKQDQADKITDLKNTNLDLDKKVISHFQELKDVVRKLMENNPNVSSADGNHNSIGFLDRTREMVHVGINVWIRESDWKYCFSFVEPVFFIREMSRKIFGVETLRISTRTGRSSNKSKRESPEKKWQKLDPQKIEAVRDCVEFFLTQKKFENMSAAIKSQHVMDTDNVIMELCADLKKPKLKNRALKKRLRKRRTNKKKGQNSKDKDENNSSESEIMGSEDEADKSEGKNGNPESIDNFVEADTEEENEWSASNGENKDEDEIDPLKSMNDEDESDTTIDDASENKIVNPSSFSNDEENTDNEQKQAEEEIESDK